MKEVNKLVRDKIPDILKKKGKGFKTHIASKNEYGQKLYEKLLEEVEELLEARNEEELADVLEVIDAIIKHEGYQRKQLNSLKKEKHKERGGFERKIILEKYEE